MIDLTKDKDLMAGSEKDKNYCTVVAFMAVFDTDFRTANNWLCIKVGRKIRRGMLTSQVQDIFPQLTKYNYKKGPYSSQNRVTIKQFMEKHSKGRYYCLVRGHAIAIVDGELYDFKEGLRRQITSAWRVEER